MVSGRSLRGENRRGNLDFSASTPLLNGLVLAADLFFIQRQAVFFKFIFIIFSIAVI
jgi:hypothetical protein